MRLEGVHHVTCITADAPRNVDFYTRVLGLRLVKKTVNQDDPAVYHLFYADDEGSPGSDITFFEYPGAHRGRAGAGMVHTVRWRVGSGDAIEFWEQRLATEASTVTRGAGRLTFEDPEGLRHELAVVDTPDAPLIAEHPEIPADLALQGFHGVRAYTADPDASRDLLEDALGFEPRAEGLWEARGQSRGGLYSYDLPPTEPGIGGAGTVHHVAWASTMEDHEAWRDRVASAGARPTPVIDRFWFRSIYFREPSGVLFEIATLGPGFAVDEDPEHLGESLVLPPAFEHLRAQIEPALTPLPAPRGRGVRLQPDPRDGLAELHTHLGGSVASDILWSLAHEQGIALPVKDFWEFDALVTLSDPLGVKGLDELDKIYHWTELIQSSPLAVERSVHGAIGGAFRSQGITTLELRFNPMKRNRGGERDLDHIILAAVRGLDLASLEYPQVRAGLILMMDRTFDRRLNEIIVEKAIRWASRGIVGIDIAGPRPGGARYDYTQIVPMVEAAREAGLGVTIHVGEEGGDMGREEIAEVVEYLRPERIGHGILAAGDPELMHALRDLGIVLEICPTSNLLTKALPDEDAVRDTIRRFVDHGVPFTIATDGPEMMRTHLRDELELLRRIGALDEGELRDANERGHAAAFRRRAVVPA